MSNEEITRAAEAPDFLVDRDIGALLNTNSKALAAYRVQRERARKNRELEARVNRVESKLDDILSLLTQVLKK